MGSGENCDVCLAKGVLENLTDQEVGRRKRKIYYKHQHYEHKKLNSRLCQLNQPNIL